MCLMQQVTLHQKDSSAAKDANQVFAGVILRNQMLLRLNSLLTCLPLDEICNTTELSNELLERLM